MYDKHYRSQPVITQAAYASTRYEAAWDQGGMAAPNASTVPVASTMSLEELRRIAIEGFSGISGVSRTSVATTSEGNYTSLPLEGRLDLMRPRPKSLELSADLEDQHSPDEGGRGHQFTSEDNTGSSTPKARPHLFYSGGHLPHSPSVSEPYEHLIPNFGSESSAAISSVASLTWQLGPQHTADRQIQPGSTSLLPSDLARSYHTGVHQSREGRVPFTAQQRPIQTQRGSMELHTPSAQVLGVPPHGTDPYSSSGYTNAQFQTVLQYGRERGPISTHLLHPTAESSERQAPGSLNQEEGFQPPVFPPTERLPRTTREEFQRAYMRRQDQVLTPVLHHSSDSGVFVRHDPEHTYERSHRSAQLLQEPTQPVSLRHDPDERSHQLALLPQEPTRPVSPPLMAWNPAVEPPPNTAPASSFPVSTYYPTVWDQSLQYLSDSSPSRDINATLFAVPPPSRIPERLVQEKHYVNVLGEDKQGETPSPDRGKIKPVFPWEDKPRLTPGRVFPSTDSPPPGQFLLPVVENVSPSPSPPLHFSPTQLYASSSPPSGFPPSFSYANVWDSVPSIQKYASRLVRPPQNVPPLAPAFDFGESRRRESALFRNWNESEESSVDGDDEDTGDEGDAAPSGKQRSRSGSFATAPYYSGKSKKKEYRSQGVQTIPKETKDQSVQVAVLTDVMAADRSLKDMERGLEHVPKLSPLVSPTGLRSPRYTSPRGSSTNLAESTPRPTLYKQKSPAPQRVTATSLSRAISSDTPSSPSSAGPPISPADARPRRAGGRVWDPARGVEIFKKGSEEVLSRFLKMGSWEEEKQSQSPT